MLLALSVVMEMLLCPNSILKAIATCALQCAHQCAFLACFVWPECSSSAQMLWNELSEWCKTRWQLTTVCQLCKRQRGQMTAEEWFSISHLGTTWALLSLKNTPLTEFYALVQGYEMNWSWASYRWWNLSKSCFRKGPDNGIWKYLHLSKADFLKVIY